MRLSRALLLVAAARSDSLLLVIESRNTRLNPHKAQHCHKREILSNVLQFMGGLPARQQVT
jgi:hypothetical protein